MVIKRLMFLLLVCIVAVSGCADESPGEDSTVEDAPMDNLTADSQESSVEMPEASGLFLGFTGNDSYKQWSIWPGTQAMMEGNGVHGDYVSIYVSENALSAVEIGQSVMPYHTLVLKEGFNADEELTGIYIMYKVEGFDPEHNDWFWSSYSADGDVTSEGKVVACINCHERASDDDYIFVNA